jgi:hypothetical protein
LFQLCPTPLEFSTFGTLRVADRKMRGMATDVKIITAGHFWGSVTSLFESENFMIFPGAGEMTVSILTEIGIARAGKIGADQYDNFQIIGPAIVMAIRAATPEHRCDDNDERRGGRQVEGARPEYSSGNSGAPHGASRDKAGQRRRNGGVATASGTRATVTDKSKRGHSWGSGRRPQWRRSGR